MTRPTSGARQWLADQIPDAHSRRYRAAARARDWARGAGDVARGARQRLGADPTGINWGPFRIPAARQQAADWLTQHRAAAQRVATALDRAGIRHFAYSDATLRWRIGAVVEDQSAVLTALRSHWDGAPMVVGAVHDHHLNGLADLRVASGRVLTGAQTLRVALPVADPDGHQLLGPECGVNVDRWWAETSGSLRTAAHNRWTPMLPPQAQVAAAVPDLGLATFAPLLETHVDDVPDPVDAVVTWVDGADPAWQERRSRLGETRFDAARFQTIDELRYCLRSLRTYAPWLRTIHLVTDDQRPDWLVETAGLRVISHHDIGVGSVFNSHAIEARLHHIPDLAEQYLYVNDDVFLARQHEPEDFFTGAGAARFFPSRHLRVGYGGETSTPSAAGRNDRRLLRSATGRVQTAKLEHTPHPQLLSVARELGERFPAEYERTARSAVRSREDISPITLAAWYGAATGRFVAGESEQRYWDLRVKDLAAALHHLERQHHLDTFCLNMGEDPGDWLTGNVATVRSFLPRYFPFVSPWEGV